MVPLVPSAATAPCAPRCMNGQHSPSSASSMPVGPTAIEQVSEIRSFSSSGESFSTSCQFHHSTLLGPLGTKECNPYAAPRIPPSGCAQRKLWVPTFGKIPPTVGG